MVNKMKKYDIFVSYSRADVEIVTKIVNDIHAQTNAKCWIDWKGVESGDEFVDVIINAIDSVDTVLFMLSESAMKSAYVKKEIDYARNTGKKIIPIVLDGGKLRGWFLFQFGNVNYTDINKPLERNQLFDNLKKWYGESKDGKTQKVESNVISILQPVSAPAKTYKVGDYYNENGKEGVVFEVSADGCHGKIVGLDQTTLMWCTEEQAREKIIVGANSRVNGKINTDKVMAKNNASEYPAFVWCRNKGKDWYLPAIEELYVLLTNDAVHNSVNKTLEQKGACLLSNKGEYLEFYWSSTEKENWGGMAYIIDMYDGDTLNLIKSGNYYVRAVSAF